LRGYLVLDFPHEELLELLPGPAETARHLGDYELYYYGYNAHTGQYAWFFYQSYWTQADAARAARYLQQYYGVATHVNKKFWRWGRE
jgi:hypothetical protein